MTYDYLAITRFLWRTVYESIDKRTKIHGTYWVFPCDNFRWVHRPVRWHLHRCAITADGDYVINVNVTSMLALVI